MQAGAWPMVPSLGAEFWVPGPATCVVLVAGAYNVGIALAKASCDHVVKMLV